MTGELVLTANQRLRDNLEELSYALDEGVRRVSERESKRHLDNQGQGTDYAIQTRNKTLELSVLAKSYAHIKLEIASLQKQLGAVSGSTRIAVLENTVADKQRQLRRIHDEALYATKLIERDTYLERDDPASAWLTKTAQQLQEQVTEQRALSSELRMKLRAVEESLDYKRLVCMQLESKAREKRGSEDSENLKRQITAIQFAMEDDQASADKKLKQLLRIKSELMDKLSH